MIDIKQIKRMRKMLGLTQSQMAKRAGVSQSLIAKIESNKIDPTYSKAMKIIQALEDLTNNQESKASELMSKKIYSIKPESDVKEAIKQMKKYQFSQMPVLKEKTCIGMVSESVLLDALIENKGRKIMDLMADCPPVISKDSTLTMVTHLLKYHQMVIVSEKGKILGILTKSDIINKMYEHQ